MYLPNTSNITIMPVAENEIDVEINENENDCTDSSTAIDDGNKAVMATRASCVIPGFKALLVKWKVQDASVDRVTGAKTSTSTPKAAVRRSSNVYQHPIRGVSDFTPPTFPHTFEEIKLIRKALKTNFVFSDLTDRDLTPLVSAFERCTFEKDQIIIQQGDQGDYFYILASGNVSFIVNGAKVGNANTVGASFGELALLYTCPRAASVVAAEETELFRVDQNTFRFILKSQTIESAKEKTELLQGVSFLKDLTETDLKKLSDVIDRKGRKW
jgi:hypothetical protein